MYYLLGSVTTETSSGSPEEVNLPMSSVRTGSSKTPENFFKKLTQLTSPFATDNTIVSDWRIKHASEWLENQ